MFADLLNVRRTCVLSIIFAACLCVPAALHAQTNPAYLAGAPPVERIKSEIKGSNATDTMARQVAVFTYMPLILERMAEGTPGRRYGVRTPDEMKLITAYSLAAYEISQAYARTHTP